jgi:hypothetical protein
VFIDGKLCVSLWFLFASFHNRSNNSTKMRFFTAFVAMTLTTSAAPLIEKREAIANTIIDQLTHQLGDMAKAINGFYPGWDVGKTARNAIPILDQANIVLETMKNGTRQIWWAQSLGIGDAIAILSPLTSLNTAVTSVTAGLMNKMSYFDIYLTPVVVQQLEKFSVEAQKLVDTVVSRLPSYLPSAIAAPFSQPILSSLKTTLEAYQKRKKQLEAKM